MKIFNNNLLIMNAFKYFGFFILMFVIEGSFGQLKTKSTEEILDNEAVVNMLRSRVSKKIILQKIQTGQNDFDITSEGLIRLKAGMIPDDIVIAMINSSQSYRREVLTNEKVIDMFINKVSKKIILMRIDNCENNFDTSSDALIELKDYKIWDSIILAIMNSEKSKEEVFTSPVPLKVTSVVKQNDIPSLSDLEKIKRPGIYFFDMVRNKFIRLDPVVLSQVNTSSGVLSSARVRAGLNNSEANSQFKSEDLAFYFITNYEYEPNEEAKRNLFEIMESPNEIYLAKFRVSRNKRDIEVGVFKNNSSSYGVSSSFSVSFKYEKLSDNIFKIFFDAPLKNGQYCFIPPVSSVSRDNKITVYDFGIKD